MALELIKKTYEKFDHESQMGSLMNYKNLIRRDVLKLICYLSVSSIPVFAKSEEIINLEKALSPRYLGDINAPIQFVEYVSLTCSHCAEFHVQKLPILKEKYIDKGKLRLEMRDFPLDGLALRAAAMARLVAKEKYYKFVNVLFKSQERWSRNKDPINELKKMGRLAGLNKSKIDASIDQMELLEGIFKMRQQAEKDWNIQSTPSFVINNKFMLAGNLSIEKFEDTFKKLST